MYIDSHGARWFKGNLHTHTTVSDGRRTPEDCIALYRAAGYDFLALTDHWKPSETFLHPSGMLLLSGVEYDFGRDVREGVFHVVAVGFEGDPGVTRGDGPQGAIDKIRAAGGLADLAHPAWSMNTLDQLLPLEGVDFTEIYNATSDLPHNCRPYSGEILDLLAARGKFWKTAAVDDAHWYDGDETRGFIRVRAEECSREAILEAMRRGDFYASQGPHAEASLERDADGREIFRVSCPPEDEIVRIVYFTDAPWTDHRSDTADEAAGEVLTEGVFRLMGRETFVRAELWDRTGRRAWTQAFAAGIRKMNSEE